MRFRTLVLDTDGLSAVARRDPVVRGYVQRARDHDAQVLVPWTVLAESLHGTGRRSREHALSRLTLAPLDEAHYRSAAALMERTGTAGCTIDALVIAAAVRMPRPVVVVTSDPRDLSRLTQDEPQVAVVGL